MAQSHNLNVNLSSPNPSSFMCYVLSCFSRVQLFVTLWTVAHQVPLSVGFSRQEYWSGLPSPSPWELPDSGTEPMSPVLQADSLQTEPRGKRCLTWRKMLMQPDGASEMKSILAPLMDAPGCSTNCSPRAAQA